MSDLCMIFYMKLGDKVSVASWHQDDKHEGIRLRHFKVLKLLNQLPRLKPFQSCLYPDRVDSIHLQNEKYNCFICSAVTDSIFSGMAS